MCGLSLPQVRTTGNSAGSTDWYYLLPLTTVGKQANKRFRSLAEIGRYLGLVSGGGGKRGAPAGPSAARQPLGKVAKSAPRAAAKRHDGDGAGVAALPGEHSTDVVETHSNGSNSRSTGRKRMPTQRAADYAYDYDDEGDEEEAPSKKRKRGSTVKAKQQARPK